MAARAVSETKQVQYLLGLSSLAEREHIELEYFEDDDSFQEMLSAEDDLIDAYARDKLAGEERRRFEKNFASSLRGRDRVQFARAFAGFVSTPPSVETDHYPIFQSPRLLRTATIATVIVLVGVLAWLVVDRRRMTNELRELRAESAEFSKRTEALQQTGDAERTRSVELAPKLADQPSQPDKPRYLRAGPTQRPRHSAKVKNNREMIINTQDASIGQTFVYRTITELPLNANNASGLLSLRPGTTPSGYVAGGRVDLDNIYLEGVDVGSPNTYILMLRNTNSSSEITIHTSSFRSWIRFILALETPAIHDDYLITIKTADGRPVTSDNWTEPLTPNQTFIDTPAILTSDLRSGDYVLLLMGKQPDGSFVKVGEYSFKVIKY